MNSKVGEHPDADWLPFNELDRAQMTFVHFHYYYLLCRNDDVRAKSFVYILFLNE